MKPRFYQYHFGALFALLFACPWLANSQAPAGGSGSSGGGSSAGGAAKGGSTSGGTNAGSATGNTGNGSAQSPNNRQQSGSTPSPTLRQQQQGNSQNQNNGQQQGNAQSTNNGQQQGNTQNPNMVNGQASFADMSSAGTISAFGANGFSMLAAQGGGTLNYQMSADTVFIDSSGRSIPRERFNSQTPAMVYYMKSGNDMIATRVVATEAPAVFSAGTITEVSPGILVIEMPGASATQVRYVNNKTTNYVDQNGEPVPVEMIKSGSPAKVFYTKVGDTLVASKVEVVRRDDDQGLPKPPVRTDIEVVPAPQVKP